MGFLDPISHSSFTSGLKVGALETTQHMTVLNKVILSKKTIFIPDEETQYVCI